MILSAISGRPFLKRSSVNLAHPRDPALARLFGFTSNTAAGVSVTPDSAQAATGVWACVDLIATSIASLPLHLYERLDDDSRKKAREHPLYGLLHDWPNPEQTSFEWREMMAGHLLLRGNAYSEIFADNSGQVSALIPRHPDKVIPFRLNGVLWYAYQDPVAGRRTIRADEMLHIRLRSRDGLVGMSPIEEMRNVVGLAQAAEDYGARFFKNGAAPLGVLEHPQAIGEEAVKTLRESWDDIHKGNVNSHRIAVLEEGMQYKAVGLTNADAQFLETRKFQLEEQARMYRVPPPMIGILDRATYANSEQQEAFFEKHTARPHTVRFEQCLRMKLFDNPADRARYYFEIDTSGLLRANSETRAKYYRERFMIGTLSQNDIRRKENEEPIDGGDRYFVPLNMVPTDQLDSLAPPSTDTPPATDDDPDDDEPPEDNAAGRATRALTPAEKRSAAMRQRLRGSYARLFRDAAERVTRKETKAVRAAVKRQLGQRDLVDFLDWLDEFYRDLADFVRRAYAPVVESYAESVYAEIAGSLNGPEEMPANVEQFRDQVADTMATRHIASSHGQIKEIAEGATAEDAGPLIETRLDEWDERRPESVARRESIQVGEAIAMAAMAAVGVTVIRWATMGDNCPICNNMNGRTVEIKRSFLAAGESVTPDGEPAFTTRRSVAHPPLHKGCDCMILPETQL